MDIASLIGIVTGFGLLIATILAGGGASAFVDVPSIMIVMGGSIAATLINFNLSQFKAAVKIAAKSFKLDEQDQAGLIAQFINLAQLARRDGILALDRALKDVDDEFMKGGLEMAVDGTEPDTIRDIMETDVAGMLDRHKVGQGIFNALGAYAPAFGMIGTLIGLVKMLGNLDDPSSIGPSMAVALITTFYGAVMGNLVYLPMAGKLKEKSTLEAKSKRMIIEGVLAIQKGVHPKNIERKLLNYIAPNLRGGEDADAGADAGSAAPPPESEGGGE